MIQPAEKKQRRGKYLWKSGENVGKVLHRPQRIALLVQLPDLGRTMKNLFMGELKLQ